MIDRLAFRACTVLVDLVLGSRESGLIYLLLSLTSCMVLFRFVKVLQVMRDHGLSIDAATKALTVSKALQREIAERHVSIVEAIDDLTSKLSFANLVRMKSQSPIAAPPTASDDISARPRIQPVPMLATQVRSLATSTSTQANSSARKTKTNSKKEACAKKGKVTSGTAGRKRSMEDVNDSKSHSAESTGSKFQSRERTDSVSEEVNAKLAENKSKLSDDEAAAQAANRSVPGVASAVRSKRGRVEGDSDTPNMKRTRTNEL